MTQSPIHSRWLIADLQRLIIPAIAAGKLQVVYDDDRPIAFWSHAFLSTEAARGYLDGTRKIQPADWLTGEQDGTLFVIDFVAPYGDGFRVARGAQQQLTEMYGQTYRRGGAFIRRSAKGNRLSFLPAKGTQDARI